MTGSYFLKLIKMLFPSLFVEDNCLCSCWGYSKKLPLIGLCSCTVWVKQVSAWTSHIFYPSGETSSCSYHVSDNIKGCSDMITTDAKTPFRHVCCNFNMSD